MARPKMLLVLSLILALSGLSAFAQDPTVNALTFQAWKDQQVLEAQNQVLRLSARINQLKTGKNTPSEAKDPAHLPSARLKKVGDGEQLALAEKDLKRAQESLQSANGLQLGDYALIYLPSLQDQPDATAKLVEKLSKEELSEITKALINRSSKPSDAKHGGGSSMAEGLTASLRSRSL